MPNHIQNKLRVKGNTKDIKTLMDKIKNGDSRIDFNKILPMPKTLIDYEPHCRIVEEVKKRFKQGGAILGKKRCKVLRRR